MNELVKEWINKAEGDYHSTLREYRARKFPNYDAAGFHAQQCIEKYLKASLQHHQIPFRKTHDLLALMELCITFAPELELHKSLLAYLNQFAVAFRYPGEMAGKKDAKQAIDAMRHLRPIFRELLGVAID